METRHRILAFDFGDRTLGLAASDPLNITAQPIKTLRHHFPQNAQELFAEVIQVIDEKSIGTILCGWPLNMNGTAGPQAKKVEEFMNALHNHLVKTRPDLQIHIEWMDERLSTTGASRSLLEGDVSRAKRKKVIDTMSAVFLLQGYLAALRPPEDE